MNDVYKVLIIMPIIGLFVGQYIELMIKWFGIEIAIFSIAFIVAIAAVEIAAILDSQE